MKTDKSNEVELVIDNEPVPRVLLDSTLGYLVNQMTNSTDKSKVRRYKSQFNKLLEERNTVIGDDFWERFILYAKAVYMNDKESDLFDVFNTMRMHALGGWEYTEKELARIDAEIAKEEAKSARPS